MYDTNGYPFIAGAVHDKSISLVDNTLSCNELTGAGTPHVCPVAVAEYCDVPNAFCALTL